MAFSELVTPKYLAAAWQEANVNSDASQYLGSSLFGAKKQISLDLSWIKGEGNLPVSLAPAAFDAEVALRSRGNVSKVETEMPLFREGFQLTEKDRRDLHNAEALGDQYVRDVLRRIFDDANNLIRGALVVPERMIWQLLAPPDGKPKISIAGNGANYAYNYDPQEKWYGSNFVDVSSTPWSSASSSLPIDNINAVVKEASLKGDRLRYAIMSQKTFNEMAASEQIRHAVLAQNTTANIYMTDTIAKSIVEQLTGVRPIVYNGIYTDTEGGKAKNFYPDKVVTLIPEGFLGDRVFAVTPEEYDLGGNPMANVSVVETGIALTTEYTSTVPVRTAIIASMIVLPTYPRMNEVYEMKVDA